MTPQMIADLYIRDELHMLATMPTYRNDLRATLAQTDIYPTHADMLDSYIRDMRDDEQLPCRCFDDLEPNDTPICLCPNLAELALALDDDDYDTLIALLIAFDNDILAS